MHFHKALSNCIQAGYVILFLMLISKIKILKLDFLYLIFCESCFFCYFSLNCNFYFTMWLLTV